MPCASGAFLLQPIDGLRQFGIFRSNASGLVGRKPDGHFVVNILKVGMVVFLFGKQSNPDNERKRLGEIGKLEFFLKGMVFKRPVIKLLERGGYGGCR